MNYQNKFVFLLCITLLSCISSSLLATPKIAKGEKKEYIDAKSVRVTSEGIFLKKGGKKIPVKSLFTDKKGRLYTISAGKKNEYLIPKGKKDSEFMCLLNCPDCGRCQSCRLLARNKGRCSGCRHMFPANAFAWKCNRCKTQNYFNPERCGLPTCRCLREICDSDF